MIRTLFAVALLAHGIGHSLGLLQVFKVTATSPQWNGESWLLSGAVGPTVTQAAGVVVWTASIIGFVALAAVVIGWLPAAWWQPLAIGSAIVSLIGLLLFPTAFPLMSTLGALAVDVVVLVGVLWLHWLPGEIPV